ncbi:hypothetical protein [Methylobacterium indicum]|uniref:hypothetical protein n=1 Tax=Methylobacterium indicum TaxID=1775910 RepID=UPI001041BF34|nr:hypothetical protein [Methylobacterium indicum]
MGETVGATAGGIAGGFVGGAVGSVFGPVGTVAGRFAGSRLGQWGGRALGGYLASKMENANEKAEPKDIEEGKSKDKSTSEDCVGNCTSESYLSLQDKKSKTQGKRRISGPLPPANGGTGSAQDDFDKLTGGQSNPAPSGGPYPPGTLIGSNGIIYRPGGPSSGPRIDIPGSGGKLHETLHY